MTTHETHPVAPLAPPMSWGRGVAAFAGAVGAFQMALALGAPWGAAAWGGQHVGALPIGLRVASGAAAVVWVGVGAVAAGRVLGHTGRRRVMLGTAIYCSLGVVVNAASPSAVERAIWVPMTVVGAGLAWAAWRQLRR